MLFGCEAEHDESAVDGGARPAPSASQYAGDIVVGSRVVSFRVGSFGDGCEDCTPYFRQPDGCVGTTDAIACESSCNPCIDGATLVSSASQTSHAADFGNLWHGYFHDASVGDELTVRIDGCLGPFSVDVTIPESSPVVVSPPQPLPGNLMQVEWSPAARADYVDVSIGTGFGGSDCRRLDTGSEVVRWHTESGASFGVTTYRWVPQPLPHQHDIFVLADIGSGTVAYVPDAP